MASKMPDYSVYLVTDSTPAILGARDLCEVVEASIKGGVTVVQYRDKHSSRDEFLATARRLLAVTRRHGVPLIVNDRVDVAAEIGCEGAHVGQDDMEYAEARKLLGPEKIIGVSAGTVQEAIRAAESGADYIGIGTVYATPTKKDSANIIGIAGLREILEALSTSPNPSIPTVAIGGINQANVTQLLHESSATEKSLDGVAVVSAVIASPDPGTVGNDLRIKVTTAKIAEVMKSVGRLNPLSHNMTNLVVQNFSANIALAIGASPIMSNYAEEAADLAALGGALVINSGTVTPEGMENYKQALKAYNKAGRPVLLDPVGAGATTVRRNALLDILSSGQFTVIKGNEGEILAVDSTTTSAQQRGVDSTNTLSLAQKAKLVRDLALRHGNVIVMTGKIDVLSDGRTTYAVNNGHELLGRITGSGCSLGTAISAMLAVVNREDALLGALTGTVIYGIAAEKASERHDVQGPGTFMAAFIDELYRIHADTKKGELAWTEGIKIQILDP